ncbi:MAG: DUF5658 family protein [Candidatus Bathyarchaeota archaeon]|nr:DUF5658 family protein [Candidatus Bathyarchaeota archaeon]
MDCLTTVVGTVFFGTKELNPLIAGLVESNITLFVVVKLTATVAVGIIFALAERMLMQSHEQKEDPSFRMANNILRGAYVVISGFLGFVVINNVLVLLQAT